MLQMTFVGLAAGVIGGGIVFGVDHVTSTSSPSASASTPSSSQGASGGVTPASGGGSGGSSGGSSPYSGGSFGAGGASGGSSSGSSVTGSGAPSDVSAIAAKVDPGLVDINSSFSYQSAAGAGTGIVVTSTGEVITNNHVINGATTVSVTDVGNGKTYKATVVGYDETDDIAVLQLQAASGLSTATLGDSSTAAVGESIVAIGNAGGAGGTPSTAGGSITGLDQSVTASDALDGTDEQLSGLLGVNADVQPGDSGGSLVNSAGQVLGIDTAGSSGSSAFAFSGQTATSQAYAIPINTATSIADQIESDHGTSTIHVGSTAFLGIETSSRDSQSGSSGGFFGGSGDSTGASGVTVAGVVAGGAAAHAGLAAGDVITSFDGQTVASASTLTDALVPLQPGDKVQVSWTDTSGQSHTATVALGSGPPA
jgi:S1-C subfamily serine protease